MILEVVASQDLWIWHAFFGLPDSLNDINVLNRSPLFWSLTSGMTPQVEYLVNEQIQHEVLPCRWNITFLGNICESFPKSTRE
jgi:hypothetical protein